jgi:bacillolysin
MKKLAFLALAMAAAGGCSEASSSTTTGATSTQLEAFDALEAATHQTWTWVQNDELKTPMHLSASRNGEPVLLAGADPAKVTIDVLTTNKALFRMHEPARELATEKVEVDELGMSHARFQQMVHGVPVAGAELMAHYDRVGHLTSIDANYVPDLADLDVNPTVLASTALATVKADIAVRSSVDESVLETEDQRLVVYVETGKTARLAFEHRVRAMTATEPAIWIITVDAKTGDVLHRYNNLQTIQGQGNGVLGDAKQFEVSNATAGFVMTDAASGVQVRTLTAEQQQVRGAPVTSTQQNSWDTGVPGAGAAVDAHFNAAAVFKYYKDTHARNAINGSGGALISTVHFGVSYDNAAWDGSGMLYGDGGQLFRPLSVSLDVVGHEFTHGVTERTSKLVYENQPGALNEAISDIFGAFIEHSVKPDATNNWKLGETVTKSGGPLRDMQNPGQGLDAQPTHMTRFVNTQQDNGGVHINSGIVNNAAYLMTASGTNSVSKVEVKYGIGWEKSEKLWYRANTKYFLANTNFGQAAQGILQAATDVGLTDNEKNIVECAFKATGIAQGACAAITNPQSSAPSTSADDEATGAAADEDAEEAADEPAPAKKRRRAVTTTSTGCNAGAGDADFSGVFGVILALAGLSAKRRTKGR